MKLKFQGKTKIKAGEDLCIPIPAVPLVYFTRSFFKESGCFILSKSNQVNILSSDLGAFSYKNHCVKVSKYGVFSSLYFPAFGLNRERYGVSLRIQSECGKIRTSKNSVFGHFSRSEWDLESWQHQRQRFL